MRTFALMAVFAVAALADDHATTTTEEPAVPCGPPGSENECHNEEDHKEDFEPTNSAEVIIELLEEIADTLPYSKEELRGTFE